MLSIGEFAAMSGLSAKALRCYDESGLLEPREVDPATGYRRYGPGQVRRAATIKLLRDTAMPLADVRTALEQPDRLERVLADHRARVLAERERQDAAMRVAALLLPAYGEEIPVRRRPAPRQAWAGVVVTVDVDALGEAAGSAEAAARAEDGFAALHGLLAEHGLAPTGPFWTTMGWERGGDGSRVLLCVPVPDAGDALADAGRVGDLEVVCGVLPERDEVAVRCDLVGDDEVLHSGGTLPGVVAFMEAVEHLGLDDREVRQVAVTGPEGPVAMDLCVTVS